MLHGNRSDDGENQQYRVEGERIEAGQQLQEGKRGEIDTEW